MTSLRVLPDSTDRMRDPAWLRGIMAGRAWHRETEAEALIRDGQHRAADIELQAAAEIRRGRR